MTPEEEKILSQAMSEAAEKSIQLQKEKIFKEGKKEGIEKGKKEGIKEGKKEGKKEGIKEGKKEIAKKLKDILTPEEIQKITGLTITTILKL